MNHIIPEEPAEKIILPTMEELEEQLEREKESFPACKAAANDHPACGRDRGGRVCDRNPADVCFADLRRFDDATVESGKYCAFQKGKRR